MQLEKKSLVEVFQKRASELPALKAEIDSLKKMVNSAVSVCLAETKQKSEEDTLAEINLRPVGVTSVAVNSFNTCCARKTCALSSFQTANEHQLECSAEIAECSGVLFVSNAMVSPYPGESITSHPKCYVPLIYSNLSF